MQDGQLVLNEGIVGEGDSVSDDPSIFVLTNVLCSPAETATHLLAFHLLFLTLLQKSGFFKSK